MKEFRNRSLFAAAVVTENQMGCCFKPGAVRYQQS